jgi:hypothetical protein
MAARGLLRTLHPDELAPATLWQALLAELAAVKRRAPLPKLESMRGLECVTAAVFKLIDLDAADLLAAAAPVVHPLPRLHAASTHSREVSPEIHAL